MLFVSGVFFIKFYQLNFDMQSSIIKVTKEKRVLKSTKDNMQKIIAWDVR